MIDIHTHILPGVDDGSRSWEETLQMCRMAYKKGISHMVATPHFIPGAYTQGIKRGPQLLEELRERLKKEGIPLEVSLAAEIEPFPEMIQWMEEGRLPLYPSGHHILVESPMFSSPPWMEDIIRDILSGGPTPILAHPERSPLSRQALETMINMGVEIQLDAGSLVGIWGRETKNRAWTMIERGWVTYVASDSHRATARNPELLEEARLLLEKERGEALAQEFTQGNPQRVIHSMV